MTTLLARYKSLVLRMVLAFILRVIFTHLRWAAASSSWLFVAAGLCLLLHGPSSARAQDIFEFQIYGARTQGQGNFAPQFLTTFVAKGRGEAAYAIPEQNTFRTAVELEYGLTDRVDVAYYFNFAIDKEGTQYAGSKLRFRGSFTDPGVLPIELGWYAEVESWRHRFDDDMVEVELMLTAQKDIGKWGLIANLPDLEKVVVGVDARQWLELSWRGEVRYRYSETLHFGLQTFGGIGSVSAIDPLKQQGQYLVPVVHYAFADDIKASFGLIMGLTTQGSDVAMLKANFTFNGKEQDWD